MVHSAGDQLRAKLEQEGNSNELVGVSLRGGDTECHLLARARETETQEVRV